MTTRPPSVYEGLAVRSDGWRRPDGMPPVVEWGPQKNRDGEPLRTNVNSASANAGESDDN